MSENIEMKNQRIDMGLKQNKLVTKDNPFAMSFLEKEMKKTFYTTELIKESEGKKQYKLSLRFFVMEQVNFHERSVYNILDLLGDVGGLFDALYGVCAVLIFLVSLITGSGAQNFIIRQVFKK